MKLLTAVAAAACAVLGHAGCARWCSAQQTAAGGRTLLRAGHVLDVRTGAEPADQTIIVQGDSILAVAATAATPKQAGDIEVDLRQYTLLPGLIDVHTHLTGATNFDPYFELSMTPAKEAIIGVENAKTTLEAGFTTVRNVGAGSYTDVALRDEIDAGHIPGPHMQVSGPPLGITGGHCDENLLPFEYHVTRVVWRTGFPQSSKRSVKTLSTGRILLRYALRVACSQKAMTLRPASTRLRRCRPSLPMLIALAGRLRRTRMGHKESSGPARLAWIRSSMGLTLTKLELR